MSTPTPRAASPQSLETRARNTVLPVGGMLLAALLLVGGTVAVDTGLELVGHPEAWLTGLQGGAALDRVANAAEVVAGVLAIAITVVAIVVELAANRYTHRIPQLFVRDPTSQAVLSFFVLTTIVCLWTSAAPLDTVAEARVTATLAMAMVTTSLAILLPYFLYLFRFLAPRNVIARIAGQAVDAAGRAERGEVIEAIEELEDMARGARQHRDRSIALAAVDALTDVLRRYVAGRDGMPDAWFRIDGTLARDPDFVALAPSAVAQLEHDRCWLEAKILRQLLSLFDESVGEDRDLGNLIALDTHALARDLAPSHPHIVDLAIRFFNSYLRVSIRAGDLRTAYYVLDRYRAVGELALERGDGERVRRVASHMLEYGEFAYGLGQAFLVEVVAYDLATLIEQAGRDLPVELDALLDLFLQVDRPDPANPARGLPGVRRTQVQLATALLLEGDEVRARKVAEDLRDEDPQLLADIRSGLESERREQYWELTDRGINFSYLPPERRAELPRFYEMLEQLR